MSSSSKRASTAQGRMAGSNQMILQTVVVLILPVSLPSHRWQVLLPIHPSRRMAGGWPRR